MINISLMDYLTKFVGTSTNKNYSNFGYLYHVSLLNCPHRKENVFDVPGYFPPAFCEVVFQAPFSFGMG